MNEQLGFETLLLDDSQQDGAVRECDKGCDCYDCDYNCEECDKAPD